MEKPKKDFRVIKSLGNNNMFFERHEISERPDNKADKDICVVVNEDEEFAILIKDGATLDTIQGGSEFIFRRPELKGFFVSLELLYMSKKYSARISWGTPTKFVIKDHLYGLPVRVGMGGSINVQVGNPRMFYAKVVGRNAAFTIEEMKARIFDDLITNIQTAFINYVDKNEINFLQFDQYLKDISAAIMPTLSKELMEKYGIKTDSLIISRAFLDAEDEDKLRNKKTNEEAKQKKEELEREEKERRERLEAESREDKIAEREFRHELELRKLEVEERVGVASSHAKANITEVKCPHCSTVLPAGAKFCYNCGKSPKNICPKCKIENPEKAKYCIECATKLFDN